VNDAEERRPISFGAVARGGALLTALLVLGAGFAYRAFIRYEPRAYAHLPKGADLVVVADLEQVILFEPVRKHLLPLLEQWPLADASRRARESERGRRSARLRERAGLNLGLDLRELALAAVPDGWVLALGGLFPKHGVVDGIEAVLRAENVPGLEREGETLVFEPSGVSLARAGDGVLVLASSRSLLSAAVTADAEDVASSSSPAGPLRVRANAAFSSEHALAGEAVLEALIGLDRVEVRSRFRNGIEFDVSLLVSPGTDTQHMAAGVERWLATPGTMTGWSGGLAAMTHAQIKKISNDNVFLETHWSVAELDRAAFELGAWLRNRLERSASTLSETPVGSSPRAGGL
jgi:hypothetical protein